MYAPSFVEKLSFQKHDNIQIYYGRNSLGLDFFCYIRCKVEGFKKMNEDFATNTRRNPKSYGEVIYRDYIAEPDEKAKKFLENWLKENA